MSENKVNFKIARDSSGIGLYDVFAQFQFSDSQVDSLDLNVTYYGFLNFDGSWYIQKLTAGVVSSSRFVSGLSDYIANFDNREVLTYDYLNRAFQ